MNARDYIYNALRESMNAVQDDIEALSTYLYLDFDDYFGSAGSQIIQDDNGIEVLSEVADEYISDKVVCTSEEGREMFDRIRNKVLSEILQDILDTKKEALDVLDEDLIRTKMAFITLKMKVDNNNK